MSVLILFLISSLILSPSKVFRDLGENTRKNGIHYLHIYLAFTFLSHTHPKTAFTKDFQKLEKEVLIKLKFR